MNELKFPLKIYKQRNGKYVLAVQHVTSAGRALTDPTRRFANWIRGQCPDVITEFKDITTYTPYVGYTDWRGYYRVRHFVAYDVPANTLLLLKLSWQYKAQQMNRQTLKYDATGRRYPKDQKSYFPVGAEQPTSEALKRVTEKRRVKPLPVVFD